MGLKVGCFSGFCCSVYAYIYACACILCLIVEQVAISYTLEQSSMFVIMLDQGAVQLRLSVNNKGYHTSKWDITCLSPTQSLLAFVSS